MSDKAIAATIISQAGVVTRHQALSAGLSPEMIRTQLTSGRWRRLFPGTYVTCGGPASPRATRWAATLYGGPGAVLSHDSAAEVWGLADEMSSTTHVTVPASRRVAAQAGLVVHRSRHLDLARHPIRLPPVTRLEDTVIDLATREHDVDGVVDWLTRACGRRLTTPERLAEVVRRRPTVRWHQTLMTVLTDAAGCHSVLEWRYQRRIERAHGLPRGQRQARSVVDGSVRYDDVRYVPWRGS